MWQKDGIFQISQHQSHLSIGQQVCCEILSNFYIWYMNHVIYEQLKLSKKKIKHVLPKD